MKKKCILTEIQENQKKGLNRREFLGTGVQAAVGYMMAPSLLGMLMGRDSYGAASTKKVVHIGLGFRGGPAFCSEKVMLSAAGGLLPTYATHGIKIATPTASDFTVEFGAPLWKAGGFAPALSAAAATFPELKKMINLSYFSILNDDTGTDAQTFGATIAKQMANQLGAVPISGIGTNTGGFGSYSANTAADRKSVV